MAVSLKFLSRAVNQTQHALAHSPMASPRSFGSPEKAGQRILGEATPKTPKTPITSPSQAAKTPLGSPSRLSPFFQDFERAAKKTGESTASAAASSPFKQPKQVVVDGAGLRMAASLQRAAACAAVQQELAASALPAAELARQSFLAKKRFHAAAAKKRGSASCMAADTAAAPLVGGLRVGGLLGHTGPGEATPRLVPELPVLLGCNSPGHLRGAHCPHTGSEKETAELVCQAFLERQGRIMGRAAVREVP